MSEEELEKMFEEFEMMWMLEDSIDYEVERMMR